MTTSTDLDKIMQGNPNAIKAADGWLIRIDDQLFHAFDIHSRESTEGLNDIELFYLPFCTKEEIYRIRNKQNAADQLLWLRAEAIADNPRFCRVFRARIKKETNWSLTNWYAKNEYLQNLTRSAKQKVEPIPAGMALLNEVNAMCCITEHGNYIAISEALENFLYYMNLASYGDALQLEKKIK